MTDEKIDEEDLGVVLYPVFGVAPTEKKPEGTGMADGKNIEKETQKRIWTLAKERAVENTSTNRWLAFSLDGMVQFISDIRRFSILKLYHLTADDPTKDEALLKSVGEYLERIEIMSAFRQVFTPMQVDGTGHLQKLYEGADVEGFAVLKNVTKHRDPLQMLDYYYHQKQEVPKEWRNPEPGETKEVSVWFINMDDRNLFTEIGDDLEKDVVFTRDSIIEIMNNEAGESNLGSIISLIFIKNFLLQLLPGLIELVTSPSEEIIYTTMDATGKSIIPRMPPQELKTADAAKYANKLKAYNDWKANITALTNRIYRDRTKQRKSVHPDTIVEKVLESAHSVNSDVIKMLIDVLNEQIAFGMNFSVSLITAKGKELTTAQNIYAVTAVTMRGVQQQFQAIANQLITEKFPAAEAAGIKFLLEELNPEDELVVAQRKKIYTEIAVQLQDIGVPQELISAFVSSNVDEGLTMTEEDHENSEKAIEAILRFNADDNIVPDE